MYMTPRGWYKFASVWGMHAHIGMSPNILSFEQERWWYWTHQHLADTIFFRKSWMTEQHIEKCHIGYTSVLWKTGIVKHECLVMLICFIEMWGNLLVKTCGFRFRPPEISGNLVTHTLGLEQWYFRTCFGGNHVLQAVISSMPSFTVP